MMAKHENKLDHVTNPKAQREGPAHHSHVGLQEHQDGEAVTNVLAVGEIVQDAINQPIASVSLSKSTGAEGQQMVQVLKKRGRPVKKYRGRMAREKQAIRDAERAEKVAVKEKKLPVLDLLLKVIEDPTVESPVEAAVLTGSSVISDTAVLHEVGDVLKELVAQIAVKELQPKSSRSRRCWEHLPVRIPSKRQEYRKLNVPVEQRNYRRAILERDKKVRNELPPMFSVEKCLRDYSCRKRSTVINSWAPMFWRLKEDISVSNPSIGLAAMEFFCNQVDERCFDVQKNKTG
ncbi:hypothetical protein KIN20_027140 [Parelaphostrongylus tenuis]|uniref:Uncharacterized protein n=1 Tax=Parelaphostrongylus tenuis TaxID=148309 RepID=A0AAD5QZ06_PARTN|nr:hypothetical protein KIN20_027140 [Parelaphostrongylus tenuis]